ncbi:hypothetical protein Hamer_G015369, partial [Homarus americanus]
MTGDFGRQVVVMLLLLSTPVVPVFLPPSVSREVVTSFPDDLKYCHLAVVDLTASSTLTCASLCLQYSGCRLYCLKGNKCNVFSAQVSVHWRGQGGPSTHLYDKCYSSWHVNNSLTHHIVSVSSSAEFGIQRLAKYAVSGFFCNATNYFCFTSGHDFNSWWRADLGQPLRVSSILVQTRRDNFTESLFLGVTVYLGNSSNYVDNPVFDVFPGSAPPWGMLVTFKPSQPVT